VVCDKVVYELFSQSTVALHAAVGRRGGVSPLASSSCRSCWVSHRRVQPLKVMVVLAQVMGQRCRWPAWLQFALRSGCEAGCHCCVQVDRCRAPLWHHSCFGAGACVVRVCVTPWVSTMDGCMLRLWTATSMLMQAALPAQTSRWFVTGASTTYMVATVRLSTQTKPCALRTGSVGKSCGAAYQVLPAWRLSGL
jgi:hypothetical protein